MSASSHEAVERAGTVLLCARRLQVCDGATRCTPSRRPASLTFCQPCGAGGFLFPGCTTSCIPAAVGGRPILCQCLFRTSRSSWALTSQLMSTPSPPPAAWRQHGPLHSSSRRATRELDREWPSSASWPTRFIYCTNWHRLIPSERDGGAATTGILSAGGYESFPSLHCKYNQWSIHGPPVLVSRSR
jgi:hypothetical protein